MVLIAVSITAFTHIVAAFVTLVILICVIISTECQFRTTAIVTDMILIIILIAMFAHVAHATFITAVVMIIVSTFTNDALTAIIAEVIAVIVCIHVLSMVFLTARIITDMI